MYKSQTAGTDRNGACFRSERKQLPERWIDMRRELLFFCCSQYTVFYAFGPAATTSAGISGYFSLKFLTNMAASFFA